MIQRVIPLVKEKRLEIITRSLECISDHPFDRAGQMRCILSLYPSKDDKSRDHREKSIVRGMVFPSLSYLGLVMGRGNSIRLSSNGAIIVAGGRIGREMRERTVGAIFLELDDQLFGCLSLIKRLGPKSRRELLDQGSRFVAGPSAKQRAERINNWLHLLVDARLIENLESLRTDDEVVSRARADLDDNIIKPSDFESVFVSSYLDLSRDSAGIVAIPDLRSSVALRLQAERNLVLTERIFDALLRRLNFSTSKYRISFGNPMGQTDKLFEYKGDYFRTMLIEFSGKG